MTNLDELKNKKDEAYAAVSAALTSGNEAELKDAMESLQAINKKELLDIHAEYERTHDEAVLEARGVKALTADETKFWNSFIDRANADFRNESGVYTGLMEQLPKTEYESIVEELKAEHPLLSVIDFKSTSAVTKWTIDNSVEQRATWKALNTKIEEELLGGPFKIIDMTLCKLSAFMVVSRDMLDLGPRWVANYALTMLKECIMLGLEYGIVAGTGQDGNDAEPIGMIRDITAPRDAQGYPKKEAIKITSFSKEVYGSLLAVLAKKDNGRTRKIYSVMLLVNPTDYFLKIFPATCGLTSGLSYVKDIFPFPTTVVQSTFVEPGEAIIGIASDYFMGLGSAKGGVIESSDHARFLEDQRVYKTKLYGNGLAKNSTSFLLLDISEVGEVIPKVTEVAPAANAYAKSITFTNGVTLDNAFDKLGIKYKGTVAAGTASTKITVTPADTSATVTITKDGAAVSDGAISLTAGKTAKVKVVITNGSEAQTYLFEITRPAS